MTLAPCKPYDHCNISFLMKQAIEEKSYTGCMNDIREAVKDFVYSAPSADIWNGLKLQVFSDVSVHCRHRPWSTSSTGH